MIIHTPRRCRSEENFSSAVWQIASAMGLKIKKWLTNSQFNLREAKALRHKAPAKRSQHANATYRNIVGRNMLRAFGHLVATCWVLLAQI